MRIALVAAPYDLGREHVGMGLGPIRYLEAVAESSLSGEGIDVSVEVIERERPFEDEISAVADVNTRLAERVQETVARGCFPMVLGGNCDSALGTLAGLDPSDIGIVWVDAHGDFNTPQTSPSGYLAGMALATVTGRCHEELWSHIRCVAPIPEENVLLVGVRDLDPEEHSSLENSRVLTLPVSTINEKGVKDALTSSLEDMRSRVSCVYLHLDIDALDPRCAPAVDFPVPAGLSVEDVEEIILMISRNLDIEAAALTAFNPEKDVEDRTLEAGMSLLDTIVNSKTEVRHDG